ncbi:MAG: hypothetical protein CMJ81_02685 [Planctomycetaceae bacterium]|nr:hypothetical protein [Planctomycetaceae bacterium]
MRVLFSSGETHRVGSTRRHSLCQYGAAFNEYQGKEPRLEIAVFSENGSRQVVGLNPGSQATCLLVNSDFSTSRQAASFVTVVRTAGDGQEK